MAGERSYVQVPPDSTGKKIRHQPFHRVGYNNRVGGHIWQLEQPYVINGISGVVFTGPNQDQGYIGFRMGGSAEYNNVDLPAGSAIQYNGVTVATTTSDEVIHIPYMHISGGNSPQNTANVDSTGSLSIRFDEGRPQLDAFGKLRTSAATILGDYVFSNNWLPVDFSTTQYGTGGISHSDSLKAIILQTGDTSPVTATANNGNGAHRVKHTSNTYHHYFPGHSQLAIMTVALTNPTEAGVMREWGYHDDYNGYFFRVAGSGGLEFCIRSSATGQVTQTCISKTQTTYWAGPDHDNLTLQSTVASGWNDDPVDGTGESLMTLSLTDDNIYWVDMQWLGAGRVRFGTYYQGQRVVIHNYYHSSNNGMPHSQTGSLPLRYCQHVMKNQTQNSVATLRAWCASVSTEHNADLTTIGLGQLETFRSQFSPDNYNDGLGLNDPRNERRHVNKTGVTTSGTTMNVPNLVGIKPRWHIHVNTETGTGVMSSHDYNVEKIISSNASPVNATSLVNGEVYTIETVGTTDFTTVGAPDNNIGTTFTASGPATGTGVAYDQGGAVIETDNAPDVDLNGLETVDFHMHVNDEYHLIGVLTPATTIGSSSSVNRTLYIPQSMQMMAYHEDGTDAFVEVEVYADPVISGNVMSMATSEADGLVYDPVLGAITKSIEPNNPYTGVESYISKGPYNGRVNFFGEGFHQLATYIKGAVDRQDLSRQFADFQHGAFKLRADNGGTNRCPIKWVYQSPRLGAPTTVRINTDLTPTNYSQHREGNLIQFEDIPGLIGSDATYGINDGDTNGAGQSFYVRHTSLDTLELFLDEEFTIPWDTSSIDNTSNGGSLTWPGTGGFITSGYGPWLYFAVVAKAVGPSATEAWYKPIADGGKGPITVTFVLTWNEVLQ